MLDPAATQVNFFAQAPPIITGGVPIVRALLVAVPTLLARSRTCTLIRTLPHSVDGATTLTVLIPSIAVPVASVIGNVTPPSVDIVTVNVPSPPASLAANTTWNDWPAAREPPLG